MPDSYVTDAELDEIAGSLAPFSRRLILMGAGFSKPYGGYLASEFWSVVVSDPAFRGRVELDRILHDTLNFEVVLARLEGEQGRRDFTDEDRDVMRAAVARAFALQDERIARGYLQQRRVGVLDELVRTFSDAEATTCLFTLNQDLLLERFVKYRPDLRLQVPGVVSALPVTVRVNDFNGAAFRAIKNQRSYIKLHGSMNWRVGKEEVIVLGGAKTEAIERFDILRMNNMIFRKALRQPGVRLLVIGYGFGDSHINQSIAAAVSAGLTLWIVDPKDSQSLRQQYLLNGATGSIWRGVVGHSACSLEELFDPSAIEHKLLFERFLDA